MHHAPPASEATASPESRADEELISIREIAHRYGVTLRALRFYEGRGLLKPRRVGAARFYGSLDRARLEMVLEGKRLGFTLTEILVMLANCGEGPGACRLDLDSEQVRGQIELLERRRAGIELAIAELRAAHDRLCAGGMASAA